MKILMLCDNYFPEMNANARIFTELAELWSLQNQQISVITSHPNFPTGKIFQGHKNSWVKKSLFNKVNLIRVKTYMQANTRFIKRILDFLSFGIMSFIVGLFQRSTNVIIGVTPQFFAALSACFLSIIKQQPFILILCDLWPDSIVANGLMKKGFLYRFTKKIEIFMYHHASGIVILSESFRNYLKKNGISNDKIYTSISGVSNQFFAREKKEYLLKKYNLSKKFVVGCVGTFGLAHNHEDILSVAKILKEKNQNIQFLMIGAGAKKTELIKQKNKHYLNNVIIDGPFPPKMIPEYLSLIDLAIVPLAPIQTNKTVLPSKMLELMAMGIPIILYAPLGEAKRFLLLSNAGWFVKASDIVTLENMIEKLSNDRSSLSNKKSNAIKFSSAFTREKQALDLLEYIESIYLRNTKRSTHEKI